MKALTCCQFGIHHYLKKNYIIFLASTTGGTQKSPVLTTFLNKESSFLTLHDTQSIDLSSSCNIYSIASSLSKPIKKLLSNGCEQNRDERVFPRRRRGGSRISAGGDRSSPMRQRLPSQGGDGDFRCRPAHREGRRGRDFEQQTEGAVSSAESAHQAAGLATRCLDDCNKLCGSGTRDLACSTRCETICRVEVESLSFAADVYAKSSATKKTAVIQAIDKQAAQPSDKIDAIAATCVGDCGKFCSEGKKDPACATICQTVAVAEP
ncbi:hypothetical protein D1007_20777 [Hordeum vulgare]|nr:hypothetical protein D1007_20777 [Hordeum vulgare]